MGIVLALIVLLLFIAVLFYGLYSRKSFRRMLPGEMESWLQEGMITEEQGTRFRQKYQLDKLPEESQSTLINAIFIFGAVLIACGIIAFIAAHWEGIPRFLKLTLLIGVMSAVYAAGYYLCEVTANRHRLGHALILLGSLIFAANIGLIAQIYHLSTNFYNGYLIWAIGTIVIAYITGSIPLADLALIASFIWFCGWKSDHLNFYTVYPWMLILFFGLFAYRKHSRSLHFLTVLGWGAGVVIAVISSENSSILWVAVVSGLTALVCWGYSDWQWLNRVSDFENDSKFIGTLILAGVSYVLSFHEIMQGLIKYNWSFKPDGSIVQAMLVFGLAMFSFVYGYLQSKQSNKLLIYSVVTSTAVLLFIAIILGCYTGFIVSTILANLAVVLWGAFLFWFGLNELDRRYFWLGLGLLVLLIVSRFFEYNTGLLLKSLAFILAGLVLIFGGVWFEKKYRKWVTEHE